MARVPPTATVNEPPLMSPPAQFMAALLATVSGAFNGFPNATLAVPCSVLAPVHWLMVREPVGVSSVPVVLKAQSIVVVPAPPIFWKVPTLINVLVPDWLARMLSITDCHKPALY